MLIVRGECPNTRSLPAHDDKEDVKFGVGFRIEESIEANWSWPVRSPHVLEVLMFAAGRHFCTFLSNEGQRGSESIIRHQNALGVSIRMCLSGSFGDCFRSDQANLTT